MTRGAIVAAIACAFAGALAQEAPRYRDVSAGNQHSCAITEPGAVLCWGASLRGQLGTEGRDVCDGDPCAWHPVAATGSPFREVVAAFNRTCALTSDGVALCSGEGFGKTFTPVPGHYLSIGVGKTFACGVGVDTTVSCWGAGTDGQLGNGAVTNAPLPVRIAGSTRYSAVGVGDGFACALAVNGDVWCWGRGREGQLGNEAMLDSPVPVLVAGRREFKSISVGADHTCGIVADSTAACWGRGLEGELKPGLKQNRNYPVTVDGQRFLDISAGTRFTCGVALDRNAYCWGEDHNGSLGGSGRDAKAWKPVTTGFPTHEYGALQYGFRAIAAGGSHVCGVVMDWSVWCWGDGARGQLGNSMPRTSYPVPIWAPR